MLSNNCLVYACSCAVWFTIFSTGGKFHPVLNFHVFTCSYSSCPFLCALDWVLCTVAPVPTMLDGKSYYMTLMQSPCVDVQRWKFHTSIQNLLIKFHVVEQGGLWGCWRRGSIIFWSGRVLFCNLDNLSFKPRPHAKVSSIHLVTNLCVCVSVTVVTHPSSETTSSWNAFMDNSFANHQWNVKFTKFFSREASYMIRHLYVLLHCGFTWRKCMYIVTAVCFWSHPTLYSPTISSAELSSPESCSLPFDAPFIPFTALEFPLTVSSWVCKMGHHSIPVNTQLTTLRSLPLGRISPLWLCYWSISNSIVKVF